MPYIMEKRGRGDANQTVPDYYLQPSVPKSLCHCLYCTMRSKTSWVEGSEEIIAGWRESNIIFCIIIFNNQLEKGH